MCLAIWGGVTKHYTLHALRTPHCPLGQGPRILPAQVQGDAPCLPSL
jgi:hypothetical protein